MSAVRPFDRLRDLSISIKHITNALIDEAEEAIPEECGKVLRLLTFRFSWLMNGKNT
jgi:hypothetical protein